MFAWICIICNTSLVFYVCHIFSLWLVPTHFQSSFSITSSSTLARSLTCVVGPYAEQPSSNHFASHVANQPACRSGETCAFAASTSTARGSRARSARSTTTSSSSRRPSAVRLVSLFVYISCVMQQVYSPLCSHACRRQGDPDGAARPRAQPAPRDGVR